jgi:DNA gyrase subunit A
MSIRELSIETEMRQSYMSYALSVIVSRALPDVRDGLKPVHRRILWSMFESGYLHNRGYRKTARVVGDVMGKYHPHGDAAISDAIARMTQDFSLRYTLIDGQGNFGTIDGDPPAAMRYTECRLDRISEELLENIREETVPFVDNFDGTEKQPEYLPGKVPNLLINGSTGIAVGMSSNMPSHNLSEVIKATIATIRNPQITLHELMQHIPAPDFPTGGIIVGSGGIHDYFETGRGKFYIRSKTEIVEVKEKGKEIPKIIVSEIPYQINKENLVKQLEGLTEKEPKIVSVNDFSGLIGGSFKINIEIELKQGTDAQAILNWLFKNSQLQISFSVINLALVRNEPQQLPLKRIIEHFIEHRKDIIVKRTQFRKAREEKEKHKLEGFLKILDHLDAVIQIIRNSADPQEVYDKLHTDYDLSEIQVGEILSLQLRRLTRLGQKNIQDDYDKVVALIAEYDIILNSEEKVKSIIIEELEDIDKRYGDKRKSVLDLDADILLGGKTDRSAFIPEEKIVIMLTSTGYIKSIPLESYKAQRRGGVGVQAMEMREGDFVKEIQVTSNHSRLVFFSTKGRVYEVFAYDIPASASRYTKGISIRNLIELEEDEDVVTWVTVDVTEEEDKEALADKFVIMATANGLIKKTAIEKFLKMNRRGKRAITMLEGDLLIGARKTSGEDFILLTSSKGRATHFSEKKVRSTGLNSRGVRGMRLIGDGNKITGINIEIKDRRLLTITENGYGKRTDIEKYRITNRGVKGVLNIKTDERNGDAVETLIVSDDDQILLISSEGKITRIRASNIRITGRNTRGVRLMRLAEDVKVIAVGKIDADYITEEDEIEEATPVLEAEDDDVESLDDDEVEEEEEDIDDEVEEEEEDIEDDDEVEDVDEDEDEEEEDEK